MKFQLSKLSLLFLALFAFTFTACDDDEDDPINDPDAVELFVSSNTTGQVTIIDLNNEDGARERTATVPYTDADGIYYKEGDDRLFQVNRTNGNVAIINDFREMTMSSGASLTPVFGTGDFTNGRGIASNGDQLVVVQDGSASNQERNRLIVYNITSNGVNLLRSHDIDFNLWGIELEGDRLYAIEDNSNRVAIFDEFFDNDDGTVTPDKMITIEGLVRTHGIHFEDDGDLMLLTDIGEATGTDSDTDGAIFVIDNFKQKVNELDDDGGTLAQNQLKTIKGSATTLGNPVDIAYDRETRRIYVAERANGGGRVLGFDYPETSNADAPVLSAPAPGASSLTFYADR